MRLTARLLKYSARGSERAQRLLWVLLKMMMMEVMMVMVAMVLVVIWIYIVLVQVLLREAICEGRTCLLLSLACCCNGRTLLRSCINLMLLLLVCCWCGYCRSCCC